MQTRQAITCEIFTEKPSAHKRDCMKTNSENRELLLAHPCTFKSYSRYKNVPIKH